MAQRLPNPGKVRKDPEAFHSAALKCCEELDEFASLSRPSTSTPSSSLLLPSPSAHAASFSDKQTSTALPFGGHFALRLRAKQVSDRTTDRPRERTTDKDDCLL